MWGLCRSYIVQRYGWLLGIWTQVYVDILHEICLWRLLKFSISQEVWRFRSYLREHFWSLLYEYEMSSYKVFLIQPSIPPNFAKSSLHPYQGWPHENFNPKVLVNQIEIFNLEYTIQQHFVRRIFWYFLFWNLKRNACSSSFLATFL